MNFLSPLTAQQNTGTKCPILVLGSHQLPSDAFEGIDLHSALAWAIVSTIR